MKTFKSFLSEGSNSNTIKSFDATKLDVKDLIAAQFNAGYEISKQEAASYRLCVYGGFKNSHHVYYAMWENTDSAEDESTPYAINAFTIAIGKEGKIECEPDGMPLYDNLSEDEAERKLSKLKHS